MFRVSSSNRISHIARTDVEYSECMGISDDPYIGLVRIIA